MHLIMGAVSLWTRPPAVCLCTGPQKVYPSSQRAQREMHGHQPAHPHGPEPIGKTRLRPIDLLVVIVVILLLLVLLKLLLSHQKVAIHKPDLVWSVSGRDGQTRELTKEEADLRHLKSQARAERSEGGPQRPRPAGRHPVPPTVHEINPLVRVRCAPPLAWCRVHHRSRRDVLHRGEMCTFGVLGLSCEAPAAPNWPKSNWPKSSMTPGTPSSPRPPVTSLSLLTSLSPVDPPPSPWTPSFPVGHDITESSHGGSTFDTSPDKASVAVQPPVCSGFSQNRTEQTMKVPVRLIRKNIVQNRTMVQIEDASVLLLQQAQEHVSEHIGQSTMLDLLMCQCVACCGASKNTELCAVKKRISQVPVGSGFEKEC